MGALRWWITKRIGETNDPAAVIIIAVLTAFLIFILYGVHIIVGILATVLWVCIFGFIAFVVITDKWKAIQEQYARRVEARTKK